MPCPLQRIQVGRVTLEPVGNEAMAPSEATVVPKVHQQHRNVNVFIQELDT